MFDSRHIVIVTLRWDCDTSGTGERREAERGAGSSMFVCVGSFSVLLNCLTQYRSTSLCIYHNIWICNS